MRKRPSQERLPSGFSPAESDRRKREKRREDGALVGAVVDAAVLITKVVGPQLGGQIFVQLLRLSGFALDEAGESHWQFYLGGLRPEHILRRWPAADLFADVRNYAFRGEAPSGGDEHERERAIEKMLTDAEALFAALPPKPNDPSHLDARRVLEAAQARWALDNGTSVNPAGLAALGGISKGRMGNLMSERRFGRRTRVGGIGLKVAEDWLRGRRQFTPSRWREHAPKP